MHSWAINTTQIYNPWALQGLRYAKNPWETAVSAAHAHTSLLPAASSVSAPQAKMRVAGGACLSLRMQAQKCSAACVAAGPPQGQGALHLLASAPYNPSCAGASDAQPPLPSQLKSLRF